MGETNKSEENRWRPVVAALAHRGHRHLYARAVLARDWDTLHEDQLTAEEAKSLAVLCRAGLLETRKGWIFSSETVLEEMLAASDPRDTTVQRFFVNGKVETYPRKRADRLELLHFLAGEVFEHARPPEPGLRPVLTEKEVTTRLAAFTADPAAIRRYLVDEGIVARDAAGTQYWLIRPRPAEGMEFA
ncbi:DUF2087 domain-containing protein [Arthrobacter zhaoxinii]|uniref:DUF2087 domain-containing protein n=1 Tax=Arthrobacter zhaoxinii TaxID=2964616 RepID=A0ABY5YNM9_9MICC|nr:DUF2087 domain-containing protein [Arthrobacter zhaoxinii]MCQ2000614.1 DUF2087 domain-containing protein [Arthrobacter zhaoxinii]UWX95924.1 DUF2087 domain-containing protein [Arthrobacter zhaoxinii]